MRFLSPQEVLPWGEVIKYQGCRKNAISRKISNEAFLQHLDQTLEFDQKVIGKKIIFGDKNILFISMFPVKDKFGDVVRALVVIRKNTVVSSMLKKTNKKFQEDIETSESTINEDNVSENLDQESDNTVNSVKK